MQRNQLNKILIFVLLYALTIVLVASTPVLFLASVTAVYHEAILWDLDRGSRIATFTFRDVAKYLHHVAFSPDGARCLICGDRTIFLVDAATGRPLARQMRSDRRITDSSPMPNAARHEMAADRIPVLAE